MRRKTVETMVHFKVYRQKLYWKKTLNIEAMKERLAGKDTTDHPISFNTLHKGGR